MTVHSLNASTLKSKSAQASVRSRVLALLEKHRANPGAPWDEDRLMDVFLAQPGKRRRVVDGFRASCRFSAFIDDVQYEFAICFPAHTRHSSYSLQEFVDLVVELDGARRRALWSWRHQVAARLEWAVTVLANILLLITAVSLSEHAWMLGVLGVVAVFVNGWFVRVAWRAKGYLERLRLRIEAAEANVTWLPAHQSRLAPTFAPCVARSRRTKQAGARAAGSSFGPDAGAAVHQAVQLNLQSRPHQ